MPSSTLIAAATLVIVATINHCHMIDGESTRPVLETNTGADEYDSYVPIIVEASDDDVQSKSLAEAAFSDDPIDRQARTRYFVSRRVTTLGRARQATRNGNRGVRRNAAYFPPSLVDPNADDFGDETRASPADRVSSASNSLIPLVSKGYQATRLCGLRLTQKSREICKNCSPLNWTKVSLIEKRGDALNEDSRTTNRPIAPEKQLLTSACCLRKCTFEEIRSLCCKQKTY